MYSYAMAHGNKSSSKRGSNFVPIFFILAAIVIISLFAYKVAYLNKRPSQVRDKIVVPKKDGEMEKQSKHENATETIASMTSFVQLHSSETLLSVQSFDFNSDSYVDQVVAVRKANIPHITLIVGLYDPDSNTYSRLEEIATNISREKTFTYAGIDVTGNHQNELVYQGVNDSSVNVMSIFSCQKQRTGYNIIQIGKFESEGTIFIQQEERTEEYMLSHSKGMSFPVWIYTSASQEQDSPTSNLSQIQTEYTWNEQENQYVEKRQIWVTGSRIAAKELSRIQDGTVSTFASFLSGLWYKISNGYVQYVFFDYDIREINFFSDSTEEVYSWDESNLRRNGIYISSTNSSITNMQRRCDIALVGLDEIRLHIVDDVRMIIKENNLWDGNYKKMSITSALSNTSSKIDYDAELKKGPSWTSDSGMRFIFSKNTYTLFMDNATDKGNFATGLIAGKSVLQYRSSSSSSPRACRCSFFFIALIQCFFWISLR